MAKIKHGSFKGSGGMVCRVRMGESAKGAGKAKAPPKTLAVGHPAVQAGHTVFQKRVRNAWNSPAILQTGQNNAKIGHRVVVGRWKGFPIYLVTLEERKTCPTSCHHWKTCYGNNMPFVWRNEHGSDFEQRLWLEVEWKHRYFSGDKSIGPEIGSTAHPYRGSGHERPQGFVVRLHILGDFYSLRYVEQWELMLKSFSTLNVYGYTAWPQGTPIGNAIRMVRYKYPDRFVIRHSTPDPVIGKMEAIPEPGTMFDKGKWFLCPAQVKDDKVCGNCGACWESEVNVAFRQH